MALWKDELAQVERAALRTEQQEVDAHGRFARVRDEAHRDGDPDRVKQSPELHAWLAARAETDAAWGRWAMVMDAKPKEG